MLGVIINEHFLKEYNIKSFSGKNVGESQDFTLSIPVYVSLIL